MTQPGTVGEGMIPVPGRQPAPIAPRFPPKCAPHKSFPPRVPTPHWMRWTQLSWSRCRHQSSCHMSCIHRSRIHTSFINLHLHILSLPAFDPFRIPPPLLLCPIRRVKACRYLVPSPLWLSKHDLQGFQPPVASSSYLDFPPQVGSSERHAPRPLHAAILVRLTGSTEHAELEVPGSRLYDA